MKAIIKSAQVPSFGLVLWLLIVFASTSFAGNATWKTSPGSGDWNTASNWSPATVPNGSSDTATFDSSNTTGVSISAGTEVNSIVFNAGASAFTITASPTFTLTISGVGITNNSGIQQNFATISTDVFPNFGVIDFRNSATAGNGTVFTNRGGGAGAGQTDFFDNSTAGNGVFINEGGTANGDSGGLTSFSDNSTAGNGTFTTYGGAVSGAVNGQTIFDGNSTAGNATFINNGGAPGEIHESTTDFRGASAGNGTFINNGATVANGVGSSITFAGFTATASHGTFTNNGGAVSGAGGGVTVFFGGTAEHATLIANGGPDETAAGKILFFGKSKGGKARVEVFGNGNLDISSHNTPGVTTGSIEGSGLVFLGANNLSVGRNNRSTTFSGVMQDGGQNGGSGGSLAKLGTGTLTLSGANTYTGGTAVNGGKLLVINTSGSGTGSGAVQVNAGTLGGRGTIGGTVTIGTGAGPGAILSPGSGTKPGTLTIQSPLVFNSDATYDLKLNSQKAAANKVAALGVTINNGALFSFTDFGGGTLAKGTVFKVINNTSANPIFGTFSNLPDGSTFSSGGNTFKANYEGGTGNDLTLTVQ